MADAVTGHDLIGTPGIRMDAVGGHQRGHGARQGHGTHARQLRAACGQVRHYGPAQFGKFLKDGIISRRSMLELAEKAGYIGSVAEEEERLREEASAEPAMTGSGDIGAYGG